MSLNLKDLLKKMVELKASDLHLKSSRRPVLRIDKELVSSEFAELSGEDTKNLARTLMNDNQRMIFEKESEIDFAVIFENIGRFRVNIFRQRGEIGIVMRYIKDKVPTVEELNMPEVLNKIALSENGLVLVTGSSSTGKSTTLSAMIDYINHHKRRNILTLENPIEYLYHDDLAMINQREIGLDTESFHRALRHVIRQDPDVIVIGEMRDAETVQTAISASETGHLVFSSFHAEDVRQAINRILDFFPPVIKDQIRMQLAINLKAIICQKLLRRSDGKGLVPAVQIFINTPMAAHLINTNKLDNIDQLIQTGQDIGMQTFNQSLVKLLKDKLVSLDEALSKSDNPEALKINIKGIFLDEQKSILG